jgi:homeodomain-containing protein
MYDQQSLQLAPDELYQLKHLVQAHRTPLAIARRAQLVQLSHTHPDWGTKRLARVLNRHESWVRKWRRRWKETHSLKDAPRSGAPRQFSPEVRAQVTALACSLPRSHDIPLSRWSRAELARYTAATSSMPTLSASTIGHWLAAEQIRGFRYHSWQHIQKPEEFLARARPVLRLYEQAAALVKRGTWVVCTDEKTSIQAREAEQAPRPAIQQHPIYQSPRYHRRAWGSEPDDRTLRCRWTGLWSMLRTQTFHRFSLAQGDSLERRSGLACRYTKVRPRLIPLNASWYEASAE